MILRIHKLRSPSIPNHSPLFLARMEGSMSLVSWFGGLPCDLPSGPDNACAKYIQVSSWSLLWQVRFAYDWLIHDIKLDQFPKFGIQTSRWIQNNIVGSSFHAQELQTAAIIIHAGGAC